MSAGACCPVCAARPLAAARLERVRCPLGHEFSREAYRFFAELTAGRGPVLPHDWDGLDPAGYDLPLYLGYTCLPGRAAKLRCLAQTPEECLALLRAGWDLRKYEPVVLALLACPGPPAAERNWGGLA
jgi:hypothetical protein